MARKGKKTEQINIRFTAQTVADLDRIAADESRDRSELARFFIEWAIAQYDTVKSIRALLSSKVQLTATSHEPLASKKK